MTTEDINTKFARLEEKHNGLTKKVDEDNKDHIKLFELMEKSLGGLNQLKGMVWIVSVGVPVILTIIGIILHMSK